MTAMPKSGRKSASFYIRDASNARDVVLFVLLSVTETHRKAHTALRETLEDCPALTEADRAFVTRTVNGTLDYLIRIDGILTSYSRTPLLLLKPLIRGILRMSVYQLLWMDRVPDAAVCNEAVRLTKLHGLSGLSGFVNGVLRTVARERTAGAAAVTAPADPALRLSVPRWLYKKLLAEFGAERTEQICTAWLLERPVTVRLNTSLQDAAHILESLREEGAEPEPVDAAQLILSGRSCVLEPEETGSGRNGSSLPQALPVLARLKHVTGVTRLKAFQQGWIQVQDAAASLSAALADPKCGDYCIDVCAAPGGKSLQLADRLLQLGGGLVEARDVSAEKVRLIEENRKRCGFQNLHCRLLDALTEDEESYCRADIVLADLPCSGLGIAGRKPDIKLNLKPYSIQELLVLQRDILTMVSRYVKPRGKLVYSTCTLTREENEEMARWAAQSLGFRLRDELRLWPSQKHDGFYVAVLERKY